jgi:hypothetical protein
VSSADRTLPELTELELQWNQRFFWRSVVLIVFFFLGYIAIAVFASDASGWIGVAGVIVFGTLALFGVGAGAWRIRRRPVAATLNEFGVTFDRHESAAWEIFREVRFGLYEPWWLFVLRSMHYIAFVPERVADLPRVTLRGRLAIRRYGTNLVLMAEAVTPSVDDILAAVERLSDVPVRRRPYP